MAEKNLLIYLMRRDLRVADNPAFHAVAKDKSFTHLLPLYVFGPKQIEVSGLVQGDGVSPYPEAKSIVGKFWRCGPNRAKFLAESIWDVKDGLEDLGSGLTIRVGHHGAIVATMIEELGVKIGGVWMTGEEGSEEQEEESDVKAACEKAGVQFKLLTDEKYLLDDRDLLKKLPSPDKLPDVFTTYRRMMEPLRDGPRDVLPTPTSLPPLPENIPAQAAPFAIPTDVESLINALQKPLVAAPLIKHESEYPEGAITAHPFLGGSTSAHDRLTSLLVSGAMTSYKDTRNGMLGTEFSAKLSAFLALGSLTARQINAAMCAFEDGTDASLSSGPGYGKGENKGTQAMRFELLWRDYMRLCTRKFGKKLFQLSGFKNRPDAHTKWSSPSDVKDGHSKEEVESIIERFLNGTTGMGLIDASQREVLHTGYTSNRARQNVASFLAKHMYIDWRIGAEWYECTLVDYDLSSNWGNWQYVSGVGNDPRDDARVFNPVKQSFDYDKQGEYVKTWVPELRELEELGEVFQCWTVPAGERAKKGLLGLEMCEQPLKKIDFTVGRRAGNTRGRGKHYTGNGRGGGGRGGGGGGRGYGGPRGGYHGGGPSRWNSDQGSLSHANGYGNPYVPAGYGSAGAYSNGNFGYGNGNGGYGNGNGGYGNANTNIGYGNVQQRGGYGGRTYGTESPGSIAT